MEPAVIQAFEEAWTRWLKAHKEHPGLYHGPSPTPAEYGFMTDLDIWHANEIERRVKKEMERTI